MKSLTASTCALTLALTLFPAPARAEPPPAAAPEDDLSAQVTLLYAEGSAARKLNQWDKARTFFLAAWHLRQHWQLAANLGLAELKTGKTRDAAEHFAFFLREAPATVTADDRKLIEDYLTQVRPKVGALKITGAPPDAEISVDDAPAAKLPSDGVIFVEPGHRRLVTQKQGYLATAKTLDVEAGKQVEAAFPLEIEPKDSTGTTKIVILAGTAASAVMLAIGTGFAIASTKDSYTTSAQKTDAVISLAISGGIGIGTGLFALLTPTSAAKPGPTVAIRLGPSTLGLHAAIPW